MLLQKPAEARRPARKACSTQSGEVRMLGSQLSFQRRDANCGKNVQARTPLRYSLIFWPSPFLTLAPRWTSMGDYYRSYHKEGTRVRLSLRARDSNPDYQIGRASCRERV